MVSSPIPPLAPVSLLYGWVHVWLSGVPVTRMWTSFSSRSMGYRHDDEQTGTVVCDSHDWNSIVMLQIDRRKTLCRLVNVDQRWSRFSEPVSTDQHLPALECTVVLDGSQPRFRLTSTGQNWSAPVFRDLFFHQHPSMAAFFPDKWSSPRAKLLC